MPAPAMTNSSDAKSPERMNAMTRKVAKKTSAVPKSDISASIPTQAAAMTTNMTMFRFANRRSSVAVPAQTKQIFASSDG